jgi:hypothetical protein
MGARVFSATLVVAHNADTESLSVVTATFMMHFSSGPGAWAGREAHTLLWVVITALPQ